MVVACYDSSSARVAASATTVARRVVLCSAVDCSALFTSVTDLVEFDVVAIHAETELSAECTLE